MRNFLTITALLFLTTLVPINAQTATIDSDGWREINSFAELIGKWGEKTSVAIPIDDDMPATSIDISLVLEYVNSGRDSTVVILNINADFDRFLTDLINSPKMKAHAIQKEAIWEKLSTEDLIQINTNSEMFRTEKGQYYVNISRFNTVATTPANGVWINADNSQIKVILNEFENGEGKEWILYRQ